MVDRNAGSPDPISSLLQEHRRIEPVLTALEACSERIAEGADPAHLREFVRYARAFVEGLHHRKEEDLLFTLAVEENVFPADILPVTDVLQEHEAGLAFLDAVVVYGDRASLSFAERSTLREAVRSYTANVRHHLLREERLFVKIASRLSPAAAHRLEQAFATHHLENADAMRDLDALAGTLVERWLAA